MAIFPEKSQKTYLGWANEFLYECEISQMSSYIWISLVISYGLFDFNLPTGLKIYLPG